MSSIEERLVRDIAAVTGGVVVTDSDLREASDEVHGRIESGRRRNNLRTIAVATAAAVVLVAVGVTTFLLMRDGSTSTRPVGPAPTTSDPDARFLTGSAPTRELIEGVWRLNDGGVVVRFTPDGVVQFDDRGTLFSDPVATGSYTIKGDVIAITIAHDKEPGCAGKSVAMRASLPEAGDMRFVAFASTFSGCFPMSTARGDWEQALPTRHRGLATLDNSTDPGWHPLSGKTHLYGVFLAQGGGHLLEMDRGGAYYIADNSGAPVDRGQWSLHGSDLTLTSSAASTDCSPGDKLVLGSLEEINPGTNVVRGTVQQNTCGAAWTPKEWILIPNGGG